MKASAFEFRFRLWIILAIIFLGFTSPWIEAFHWGTRSTAWLWLGFQFGSLGVSSTTGFEIVTAMAIASAAIGAALRVWGTAYLGTGVVNNAEMKATGVLADGPYRYVRNPLYLGSFFMFAAIAVLMPPTGATVTLVLLTVFQLRLILGEEAFLAPKLGPQYAVYLKAVPRLIPRLRSNVASSGRQSNWGRALLGEITPLGVLVSFAALSWQYNSQLLIQAVLVSFGLSLVVRALIIPKSASTETQA